LTQVAKLFADGQINPGDQFIFTDAWNTSIIQLKYMSELLGIPVKIHALWHAGSYDPHDFLGRLIGDKPWVRNAEASFFYAADYNHFATDFHIDLLGRNLFGMEGDELKAFHKDPKVVRTGWPMEYMTGLLQPYKGLQKRNLILFPHRIAPEKQPELFRELASTMPEYEWVICQERELTKHQYHTMLGEAKLVLSLNLQETLGISCFEGAIVDALPLVPDRLSYTEMYANRWKYPANWATKEAWDEIGRDRLAVTICDMMKHYDTYLKEVNILAKQLQQDFFSANALIDKVFQ
jgi:hypothetical protein